MQYFEKIIMINELIFILHTLIISLSAIIMLRIGKEALVSFICLQNILANLFVIKAITLFGLTATGADAFTMGSVFGFHLLQEFYGREITKKVIWLSFGLLFFYIIISQIHLLYIPAPFDTTQQHFVALFGLMPRVAGASLISYLIAQQFDCFLYEKLRKFFGGSYLPLRNYLCAATSQLLDTIVFSVLGLWGIIDNIGQVIFISYIIKLIALALDTPFLLFVKRIHSTTHKASSE